MRTAKIAIFRWALIGCLGLVPSLGLPVQQAQAAAPPERILPDTTVFMLKLNDAKSFREAFRGSQYGQLWNDPALKDFRDELGQKLAEATKALKEKIGVSLSDLIQLPQGTLAIAAIAKEVTREEGGCRRALPVDGRAHGRCRRKREEDARSPRTQPPSRARPPAPRSRPNRSTG